jgi:hypothetical protein
MNDNLTPGLLRGEITPEFGLGIHVYGRIIKVELEPRAQFVIVIDDHTTQKNIQDAWGQIKGHLQNINSMQGSNLNVNQGYTKYGLTYLNENGLSYQEIAKIINFDCIALIGFLYQNRENVTPELEADLSLIAYLLNDLYETVIIRITKISFDEWKETIFALLDVGKFLFALDSYPTNKKVIRETIRYFKTQLLEGKIIPKTGTPTLISAEYCFLREGYYLSAINLIKSMNSQYWKKIQPWVNRRMENIELQAQKFKAENNIK